MYKPIGGAKIAAHPTKILHSLQRPYRVDRERCKLPDRSRILMYCVLAKHIWLQHFGSLVSIEMSGKMKANPGSSRIWYLLTTYAIQTS